MRFSSSSEAYPLDQMLQAIFASSAYHETEIAPLVEEVAVNVNAVRLGEIG